MVGKTLGHYEILEPLGAGGMGEVYRARDSRLDRDVAIKVLPEDFAGDADRLARFEREARLLASLNHANIAAIYGLEDEGDQRFIVMEVVEGETLAERIARSGRIEVDEALDIARQIAEALEAAHENGVIHRDLKPANVIVTPDGKPKVLDFGLAKAYQPAGQGSGVSSALSHSPTVMAATQTGVIMGTAAYMSPEQAKGKPVDKRADVWAYGAVLYEMLVGRSAFRGEDVSETLAAILKDEPDWDSLPPGISPSIPRLLRRCLVKAPRDRLHDVADARIELADLDRTVSADAIAQRATHWAARWAPVAWMAIGALVGAMGISQVSSNGPAESAPAAETASLSFALPAGAEMSGGPEVLGSEQKLFDLSPDGTAIAYTAAWNRTTRLYYRRLADPEPTPVEGTENGYHPFFSPDGDWIGFIVDDTVMKKRLRGGEPEAVGVATQIAGAAWADDGHIYVLVKEGSRLARIHEDSGPTEELVDFEVRRSEIPGYRYFDGSPTIQALPHGGGLLLSLWGGIKQDGNSIVKYSPAEDRLSLVHAGGYAPRYSATGHLLFVRGGALMAAAVDPDTLEVLESPAPVMEGLRVNSHYGSADYDISQSGDTLVYVAGGDHAVAIPTWVDLVREDTETPWSLPAQHYGTFRLSPDGQRLAMIVAEATDALYLYANDRFERMEVAGSALGVAWAPDGSWLAYSAFQEGRFTIYRRWGDGRQDEPLISAERRLIPDSFTPDGNVLSVSTDSGVFTLDLTDDPPSLTPFYESEGGSGVWGSRFSPDGGWIAYISDEAGLYNIYVRAFPDDGRSRKVSTDGGEEPVWSPDGTRLFYRWGAEFYSANVNYDLESFSEPPVTLFRTDFLNVAFHSHDIDPEGNQVLVMKSVLDRTPVVDLRVLLNWAAELGRAAPAVESRQ